MTYHTYMLKCADGSYYIGHTEDLEERLVRHNSGRGPKFTAARRPVTLVYCESFPTKAEAASREIQLKKWSRTKKEALIDGDKQTLAAHARCRTLYGKPT